MKEQTEKPKTPQTYNPAISISGMLGNVLLQFKEHRYLTTLSVARRCGLPYKLAFDKCVELEDKGLIEMVWDGKFKGYYKYVA